VHGVGNDQCLGHDAAVVTDLDVLGIKPQIRVGAFERALTEQLDLLVQATAER
jgi:hypothetical protein